MGGLLDIGVIHAALHCGEVGEDGVGDGEGLACEVDGDVGHLQEAEVFVSGEGFCE